MVFVRPKNDADIICFSFWIRFLHQERRCHVSLSYEVVVCMHCNMKLLVLVFVMGCVYFHYVGLVHIGFGNK
jgi:hypothetical protein